MSAALLRPPGRRTLVDAVASVAAEATGYDLVFPADLPQAERDLLSALWWLSWQPTGGQFTDADREGLARLAARGWVELGAPFTGGGPASRVRLPVRRPWQGGPDA